MGCASGCVKCCLNTVNTLWAIGSIALIAFAAVLIGSGPSVLIYLMFFVGGTGLIAAILGCCGICQEHICMTTAYFVLILVSLVIQIGAMIFASSIDGIRKYADEDITKLWNEEVARPGAMDFPQQSYKCCGKDSPNDYITINRDYPKSCYPRQFVNQTALYVDGCIQKAEEAYVLMTHNMLNGSWGSIVFTIIMLVFSGYLILRFRRKQRHYNY